MPETPKPGTARRSRTKKAAAGTSSEGSVGSSGSTPGSSATDATNPLGLEPDTFTPPEQPTPADATVEVADYAPPPPELVEWTPERAGAILRAGGFLLHAADPVARLPEGHELWRATEDDVDAIGPPLSRILNRYEPARRLAGVSDETELAFGVIAYTRRNLATRGRALTAEQRRAQEAEAVAGERPDWAEPQL